MRLLALALVSLAFVARAGSAQVSAPTRGEIDAFNDAMRDATRRMDTAAIVGQWEDDGISLLPSTRPLVGKQAIAAFIEGVTSTLAGARMERFTMECHDIDVAGSWASEWCVEHQVVALTGDKHFDGWGKMLLVLHRGADGQWRLHREMWNEALPLTGR